MVLTKKDWLEKNFESGTLFFCEIRKILFLKESIFSRAAGGEHHFRAWECMPLGSCRYSPMKTTPKNQINRLCYYGRRLKGDSKASNSQSKQPNFWETRQKRDRSIVDSFHRRYCKIKKWLLHRDPTTPRLLITVQNKRPFVLPSSIKRYTRWD